MSLFCVPVDHGSRSDIFQDRPHTAGRRLLVPNVGGTLTKATVKGGGNMSAYIVVKDEGKTLLATVINANDAAEVGGNPMTLTKPKSFSVAKASQVYGPSNDAKSATQVIPAHPLPDDISCNWPKYSVSADAEEDENELNIDLAGSSATVFILTKN